MERDGYSPCISTSLVNGSQCIEQHTLSRGLPPPPAQNMSPWYMYPSYPRTPVDPAGSVAVSSEDYATGADRAPGLPVVSGVLTLLLQINPMFTTANHEGSV
jgi:hypothetical protein